MDNLLWNDSWSNDDDNEENLFVSGEDPSRCSSPPLQELQTVARILGLPEVRPVELLANNFLCDREKSWPAGASSGGGLLEELENDRGRIAPEGGFRDIFENQKPKEQNPTREKQPSSANNNSHHFQPQTTSSSSPSNNNELEPIDRKAVSRLKELMYHAAVFRPMNLELETVDKKRIRRNIKMSNAPQTVAARKRREKISEKIKVLQRLVPGGSKMDTASLLDEAASYLKFLRAQIKAFEGLSYKLESIDDCLSTFNSTTFFTNNAYFPL